MDFPVTGGRQDRLLEVLDTFEPDFTEMNVELSNLPSALSRFERTGVVSTEDALTIGVVGMAARSDLSGM